MADADTLQRAIEFAVTAHRGQLDRDGYPYILHPLRIMAKVQDNFLAASVAVLHDVLEDTPATLADIVCDVDQQVAQYVWLLTRKEGVTYADYIGELIKTGSRTILFVKLADVEDNLARTDPSDSLYDRYEKARKRLSAAIISSYAPKHLGIFGTKVGR